LAEQQVTFVVKEVENPCQRRLAVVSKVHRTMFHFYSGISVRNKEKTNSDSLIIKTGMGVRRGGQVGALAPLWPYVFLTFFIKQIACFKHLLGK